MGDNVHAAATEPIDVPLDSYSNATRYGAEHVRKGVAQVLESVSLWRWSRPVDRAADS